MVWVSDFSTNAERVWHLRDLFREGKLAEFHQKAWEWSKNGPFTKKEFLEVLSIVEGVTNGYT